MLFKKNKKSSYLILLALIIVLLGVGGFILVNSRSSDSGNPDNEPAGTFTAATEQEKAETEAHKKDLVEQAQQAASKPSDEAQKKQVAPVITGASQDGIYAYIDGVFEDNGTCTFTLTQGEEKIQKTSKGFANATNTSCTPVTLSRGDFPHNGQWITVVEYASGSATGTSQPREFTVQ